MENSYSTPELQENILDGADISLQQAGPWRRLANFLIDIALYYLFLFIFFVIYAAAAPAQFETYSDDNTAGARLHINGWGILLYLVIYTLMEWLFKGKTLGKLITGTRAVNLDGSRIGFRTAFLRTLSRLVPFEPFSALGTPSRPWHDRWTDSYVINERRSNMPL